MNKVYVLFQCWQQGHYGEEDQLESIFASVAAAKNYYLKRGREGHLPFSEHLVWSSNDDETGPFFLHVNEYRWFVIEEHEVKG